MNRGRMCEAWAACVTRRRDCVAPVLYCSRACVQYDNAGLIQMVLDKEVDEGGLNLQV